MSEFQNFNYKIYINLTKWQTQSKGIYASAPTNLFILYWCIFQILRGEGASLGMIDQPLKIEFIIVVYINTILHKITTHIYYPSEGNHSY